MHSKQINSEIKKAKQAIDSLPLNHSLAPESYKEELRDNAKHMSCGGMFNYSPRNAGQSYNAMWAEQCGELTLSKLSKVLRRMIDAGFGESTMWHHTGQFKGHMNSATFYAGCDFNLEGYENYLKNQDNIDAQRAQLVRQKEEEKLNRDEYFKYLQSLSHEHIGDHIDDIKEYGQIFKLGLELEYCDLDHIRYCEINQELREISMLLLRKIAERNDEIIANNGPKIGVSPLKHAIQKDKLTDDSIMSFGKFKGEKLANVPAYYLLWLYNNNKAYPEIREYIHLNLDGLRYDNEKQKWG